jgi:hypothetical protein
MIRSALQAAIVAVAVAGSAAYAADAPTRMATPAEESARLGSGTAATNGNVAVESSQGETGGTTIGSGTDTASTPGLAVDQGTVMRPLSASGTNRTPKREEPRRAQLYGVNPKADDARATQGSR